jgi:protoporphyrinogen oxidase
MSLYDLIIVGAGAAGLRVGIKSLKKNPQLRCCILEKYGYIGGRVVTFRKNIPKVGEVQWENGAGRISTYHKKVISLLHHYNLTFVPIGEDIDFINSNYNVGISGNLFNPLIKYFLLPLLDLPHNVLANHTLKSLLEFAVGRDKAKEFYEQFPYFSEIHTLRADIAINSFLKEMGTYSGFGVVGEGYSALTDAMANEFIQRGGSIIMDTDVFEISVNSDKSNSIKCKVRDEEVTHTSKVVVLALHSEAVKNIKGVSNLQVLKYLKMEPLLRMYAIFPVRNSLSWFSGLNKIVTNSPIRYIIPVDPRRGIVMISYTDGDDANWWFRQHKSAGKYGEDNVKELVMSEIRKLFPDRVIPDPIFFKYHPWYEGCTYWIPGNYDVVNESEKSLHPKPAVMPNLFMCGESFAVNQCWVESALEQADKLLDNNKFRAAIVNDT